MRYKMLELLVKAAPVAPYMQDDPRYNFDQPEYHMSKEFREFAKAKSRASREDRKNSEKEIL